MDNTNKYAEICEKEKLKQCLQICNFNAKM